MNGDVLDCGCVVGSHWCSDHMHFDKPWIFKDGEPYIFERFYDYYGMEDCCTCREFPPCGWCVNGYCKKHDDHCSNCGCNPIVE